MKNDRNNRRKIGEILKEKGLITDKQLEESLEEQKKSGKLLGRALIEKGFVKESDVLDALGVQSGMEVVNLNKVEITQEALDKVPASIARVYNIMPIRLEKNVLIIAIYDPQNVSMLDDLQFMFDCSVKGVVANEEEIKSAIQRYYGAQGESIDELLGEIEKEMPGTILEEARKAEELEEPDISSLQELAAQAPIVKLLNLILLQAIKDRASDIHFEPFEKEFKVRYRVDGALYEMVPPPKHLSLALSSRIKVLANMDIAERRLPQDGRIMLNLGKKYVDLRVSTLPTVFGESVVMRVLDKSVVSLSLDQIGFAPDILNNIKNLIQKPNGIILATGPTGSGKTTTLYSCLKEINKIDYKIITTEDPVEYDIAGIVQVGIKSKIGLTFASCLRSILRQDPDIVLVGEIRDVETAQISMQASLTGHLVFSTLHTNDAPGAITRLADMGIEPFLITSTLEAILAQRLVRTICKDCRESYIPDESLLKELGVTPRDIEGKSFYYGKGCERCNNTGYKGRAAIAELLVMEDSIMPLIIERAPTADIRKRAQESGMRTLREDGLLKIYDGITTIEEVLKETQTYV